MVWRDVEESGFLQGFMDGQGSGFGVHGVFRV